MRAYPNLRKSGWKLGVHRAPAGYEHPWLVVFLDRTEGCWSRAEARATWANDKKRWIVTNVYGIRGESSHRTPAAAIRAASNREGEGWIVLDEEGNVWGRNGADDPVIVHEHTAGWFER